MLISNNLLIKLIDMDLLLAMRRLEDINEIAQKLLTVILNISLRVFADEQNLSNVTFALDMTVKRNGRNC